MVADLRKNVCVVGDDDQSIYGFRGADSSIFKEFSRKYPGSVQIILGTNYRSLPYIIEGADKVIRNNENRIVKNMSAYRQGEGKVHIRQTAFKRYCNTLQGEERGLGACQYIRNDRYAIFYKG